MSSQIKRVSIIKVSDRAYHCWLVDYETDRWIPKSQVSSEQQDLDEGYRGPLNLTLWLALKLKAELDAEGLESTATKVYRAVSQEWHPDVSGNSGEGMKAINDFWDRLKAAGAVEV